MSAVSVDPRFSIFTFDTSHHALWAEEVAREKAVPTEVIPAPPESGSKCDLALRTMRDRAEGFRVALADEGIEFREM
jgi:hypothetical protein